MTTRRVPTITSLLLAGALLAGCTGDDGPAASADPGGRSGQRGDAAPAAVPTVPAGPVTVAAGTSPAQVTAAVSRALFRSAPAVVVALASDPAAVSAGAEQAGRLGVPMLLDDGDPAAATGTPAAPPATSTPPAPAGDPVVAELDRLGPSTVLALGAGVPDRLGDSGAEVVTDAGRLPAVGTPERLSGTAVLVQAGDSPGTAPGTLAGSPAGTLAGTPTETQAGTPTGTPTETQAGTPADTPAATADAGTAAVAAAAGATGKAAGATVVPVRGTDPRADAAAVEALAAAKPEHVVAAGSAFGRPAVLAERVAVASTGVQLPGGGQTMLPGKRLVAMYGHPGTAALGVLGEQPLPQAIARAKQLAAPYQALSGSTPVVPTFEIIATVATAGPGPDGNYSFEAPISLLKPWVDKAGAAGVYVVLDLQPGRTDFLTQAKRYEPLLRLPHVGLALDPEWRLKPGQQHLTQIGSVSAAEVNSVYRWLADLTAAHTLPQKLFVIHQFRLDMIGDDQPLQHDRDGVELLLHMDGQGPTGSKDATWAAVVGAAPRGVPFGWKNFYDEDQPMLTPAQTMTRKPTPSMISYQ